MTHKYFVYITTNKYRTVFYIWVTNNLTQRIEQHKAWVIEWFTKNYHASILVYYEEFQYIDEAILREKQLKWWIRQKKIDLIKNSNPTMEELVIDIL